MRLSSLLVALTIAVMATSAACADGVNLSEKISATYPWPAYGGHCAPLCAGEAKDILPQSIEACVSFSGNWISGYVCAGEPVAYKVTSTCADGEWRELNRMLRCGNPARGKYWSAYAKPVVVTKTQNVLVDRPVYVDRPVEVIREVDRPVEVVKTETVYVDRPVPVCVAPRQFVPPPGISPLWTPALPVNTGSRVVGQWQLRIGGAVAYLPERGCHQKTNDTCGPPPDGGVPSPDPGAAGDTGCTPPSGDSGVGGPTAGPPPPPQHGNGGAVTPPSGESPVTPAAPSPTPFGSGNIVPNTE